MALPPFPGTGHYILGLNAPGFYLLLLLLLTFTTILFLLHRKYPGRRRAVEGFYDAAAIDGASWWRRLRSITLPLISGSLQFRKTSIELTQRTVDGSGEVGTLRDGRGIQFG